MMKFKNGQERSLLLLVDHIYDDLKHYRSSYERLLLFWSDLPLRIAQFVNFIQESFEGFSKNISLCFFKIMVVLFFSNLTKAFNHNHKILSSINPVNGSRPAKSKINCILLNLMKKERLMGVMSKFKILLFQEKFKLS